MTPLLELVIKLRAALESNAQNGFRREVLTCVPVNAFVDSPQGTWRSNLDSDILWTSYVPLLVVRVIAEANRKSGRSRELPSDQLVPELAVLDSERSETRALHKELIRIGIPVCTVNLREPNWLQVWQDVKALGNQIYVPGRQLTGLAPLWWTGSCLTYSMKVVGSLLS